MVKFSVPIRGMFMKKSMLAVLDRKIEEFSLSVFKGNVIFLTGGSEKIRDPNSIFGFRITQNSEVIRYVIDQDKWIDKHRSDDSFSDIPDLVKAT